MDITTIQNEVTEPFELASRWRRLFANFIDFLLVLLVIWVPVIDILLIVYFFTRDSLPFLDGQSIGKKLLGIRVLKAQSLKSTKGEFGVVFLRTLPEILPFVNVVDACYIFSESRQRIGDRWAKTIVVIDKPEYGA